MYILKKFKEYLVNNKEDIVRETGGWLAMDSGTMWPGVEVVDWSVLLQEIDRFSAEYQKVVE